MGFQKLLGKTGSNRHCWGKHHWWWGGTDWENPQRKDRDKPSWSTTPTTHEQSGCSDTPWAPSSLDRFLAANYIFSLWGFRFHSIHNSINRIFNLKALITGEKQQSLGLGTEGKAMPNLFCPTALRSQRLHQPCCWLKGICGHLPQAQHWPQNICLHIPLSTCFCYVGAALDWCLGSSEVPLWDSTRCHSALIFAQCHSLSPAA